MDLENDDTFYDPQDVLSQFGGLPIREEEHYVDEALVDDQNVYVRGSEGNSVVDKPYVGQEFDNLDDVYNFYNCYALQKGFGVIKSSISKSSATREVVWKKFVCDKAGWKKTIKEKRDGSEVVQRHRETKVGCTTSLNVQWKNHGKWVVTAFEEEHCHTLDTPRRAKMHRSHNVAHRNPVAKDLMDQLHTCGIRPSAIAKAINATGNDTAITTDQVVQHLRKHRLNNVGQEAFLVASHF
ncbi:FAR1 domain-containing protein [Cephalotus follicularis]|uniref:FAR1 domain-containing protein n=1 Tax=Cephalotus follicularis TaxID=3775 RepID=A0A1Q3CHG0_CEPFO|nr:FAR1 domain-containing protein [Cephalotus follicularis]